MHVCSVYSHWCLTSENACYSVVSVRRKIMVLDLDETLIHSHHDGYVYHLWITSLSYIITWGQYCCCVTWIRVHTIVWCCQGHMSCWRWRRKVQLPMLYVLISKCKLHHRIQIINYQIWKLLSWPHSLVMLWKRVAFCRWTAWRLKIERAIPPIPGLGRRQ